MAKVVCIDEGTARDGLSFVGDVVSTHDDDVELSGPGYVDFQIYSFPSLTKEELDRLLEEQEPEIKYWKKAKTIEAETSPGVFEVIEKEPKYRVNLDAITAAEKTSLSSGITGKETVQTTISSRAESCIIKQVGTLRVAAIDTKLATKA